MEQSEAAPDRAAREDHESDLVVALPHLLAVESKLAELSVGFKVEATHAGLGLALLSLPRLAADARRFRNCQKLVKHARDARISTGVTSDPSDLDLLMFKIRSDFARRYHGWKPTIGKNRYVEPIHPWGPEIVGGTKGYWTPVDATTVRISRPTPGPGRPVRVGILDTAIDGHPLLLGAYVAAGKSILPPAPWHAQAAGHATFIAGVILQRAAAVELDVRCSLGETGAATVWDTARAMMTFARSGVEILNLSWGCRVEDGQPPLVLARAVQLLSQNMVIVAAAGNHGRRPQEPGYMSRKTPTYPAALPDVVAVAASDRDGRPALFNPRGPWINLLARGVDVDSTFLRGHVLLNTERGELMVRFDGYARGSGTSFAAANVSGELAACARHEDRSPREVLLDMLNQAPDQGRYQARPYIAVG